MCLLCSSLDHTTDLCPDIPKLQEKAVKDYVEKKLDKKQKRKYMRWLRNNARRDKNRLLKIQQREFNDKNHPIYKIDVSWLG